MSCRQAGQRGGAFGRPDRVLSCGYDRQPVKNEPNGRNRLTISDGREDNLTGKCVYFARVNPKGVDVKTIETDVAYGEILGSPLASLQVVLQDIFQVCFLSDLVGPPRSGSVPLLKFPLFPIRMSLCIQILFFTSTPGSSVALLGPRCVRTLICVTLCRSKLTSCACRASHRDSRTAPRVPSATKCARARIGRYEL